MNLIRVLISLFILVLIILSGMGWVWTGNNQPAAQALASRVVLTISIAAGVVGLMSIWRPRPTK
jgi:hypothetical protein